ncbi:FAD-dependent tricarballylate dehydrogenase TcuA [Paracoccus laeviglucosivorans]|uniref:Tricarballylate dehydrogenase n=1 Tax=Paracoccus laeviglucosivorans TaxID=1197861 RepID=A0A521FL44_9RHOB|nr:FAD-dependent tricarballylate dehydrogenase TcuA [Paracoccus laeviglucosivorans]SMO96836.1 tricarballylate dehydrogenase [Paracoccus laeviglucosivorans]
MPEYDVIVVGAGNAALCAALSAHENGARVLVLERAPEEEKGGNSYFTAGGFRFAHEGLEDVAQDILTDLSPVETEMIVLPPHSREFFYNQLMDVTHHQSDEDLANLLVDNSRPTMAWLRSHGIRFVPMFGRQSYLVDGKHHFYGGVNIEAVGGGAGLVEAELARAQKLGIEIRYNTAAIGLLQGQDRVVSGVKVRTPSGYAEIGAKAVILACGGFESNPEMRVRYLGPGWDLCRVRGTRHNMGEGINMALAIGARPYGNWSSCHACEWDISAPPYGDRWVLDNFQKHSYPLGIMVNLDCERFVDEGEDYRNLTYAKFGREIMKQPRRTAIQIFDQQTVGMLRDEYRIKQVTKAESGTIAGLAELLELDPVRLEACIAEYNAACGDQPYNPAVLDGKATTGISPPKSNWALPIDKPPYVAFVTTTGITFTFGGLQVNTRAEVQDMTDQSIPGLYAAGELVGGLFYENYPGGTGLMSGSVFGKRAGESAASYSVAARAAA